MTQDSVDGRPPSHRQRFTLWTFFVVLGFIVLAAAVVLAVVRGVSLPAVALGAFLCIVYFLLAVWPAWGAGLLRGTEERAARQQAVLEVRTDGEPEHLPHSTDRTI